MKPRGAVVVVFGLLLAGCSQGIKQSDASPAQAGFGPGEYELFFNGEPIEPSKYVQMRSVKNLLALPQDMRYDLKRALSQSEFNALPFAKRQLLGSAKPNPSPDAVDAYTFVRSLQPDELKLFPEWLKQEWLKGLTEEQLSSLPFSTQDALRTAK